MRAEVETSVAHIDIVVTPEMVARLGNEVLHPVYSTFWLCFHAEVAARQAIEPYFEGDDNACGTALSISHKAMAAVGASVRITARVTTVIGNRITCDIEARISGTDIILATGQQQQAVLPKATLAELAATAHC